MSAAGAGRLSLDAWLANRKRLAAPVVAPAA
jgi:hypothetical protein